MHSLRYLQVCATKSILNRGFTCPSCGGAASEVLDRKYVVTSLRRCQNCFLLFRTPTTTVQENARFYQTDYTQGTTTSVPDDTQLEDLKRENFATLATSYLSYISVLKALDCRRGQRVLDFGCSWGYGSYQLRQAGYLVDACEVSRPRAEYARRKLGVNMLDLADIQRTAYDVFLSVHVIEHVPSVSEMIKLGERALKPGGLFVAFTPNGSAAFRKLHPEFWHRSWGCVHPQLIDDIFLRRMQPAQSILASTTPYPLDALRRWDGSTTILSMAGGELMLVFRTTGSAQSKPTMNVGANHSMEQDA